MTEPEDPETGGVLASLPTTRPQRRSAKRPPAVGHSDDPPAAAKPRPKPTKPKAGPAKPKAKAKAAIGAGAAKPTATAPPSARPRPKPKATADAGARAAKAPASARPQPQPASVGAGGVRRTPPPAAQGFGPDTARGAVEPPTRTDLLGSVAAGAGDLVHVGLDLGRVLLRSVVRRLPGR